MFDEAMDWIIDQATVQMPAATIIRLLPKEGAEYQYHIQIETDGLLQRGRESQLRAEN